MSAAKKYFNYLDLSSLKLWRIKFKSSKTHITVMMPASCVIIYVNFDFCDFKCVHLFKTAIHGIDVDIWVLVKGSRQKMFSKAARGKNRFLLFRFCQTFIDNCCCCMCSFCPATQQPMEIEWKKTWIEGKQFMNCVTNFIRKSRRESSSKEKIDCDYDWCGLSVLL